MEDFNYDKFFTLKHIRLYLNFCGVAVGKQKNEKLFSMYKYYLLASFTILTYGQLMHYQDVKDVPAFAKTTVFVLSGFYLNFCTLYVHFKKNEFLEIMKLKNDNFYTYSNYEYDRYGNDVDERFRKIVLKYGKIWILVYTLIEVTPLITTPFSSYELGSPETLMMPCKYPWKANTRVSYLLTYLLQVCSITPISFPVFGMFFFIVYFVMEVRTQAKKICWIIDDTQSSSKRKALNMARRNFSIDVRGDFNTYRFHSKNHELSVFISAQYNRISLEKLTHCVRHHQKIIKFINNFVLFIEAVFIGDLIYSLSTITLSGYTVVGGAVRFSLYSQYISLVCLALIYILVYCHLGEIISDCNYRIQEALYNTDWYNLNTSYRKMLIVFMCNTQHHRNLKASVNYIASYELFTKIIKGCYTFMNLLLQSFSR